jgi:hypothetical protein
MQSFSILEAHTRQRLSLSISDYLKAVGSTCFVLENNITDYNLIVGLKATRLLVVDWGRPHASDSYETNIRHLT